MALKLSTWMVWTRCLQLACCTVILTSNGWLINLISTRKLGLGPNMLALEMIAGIAFIHIFLTLLILHILHRSTRKAWLITFIVWDLIFIGVCIGMISIYSFAGVPSNCGGMTRSNWNPGDAPNNPAPGFTTVRFGPGLFGNYGELDIYCDIPQTDYAFVVLLLFTYMLTLILSTTRILSFKYTPNNLLPTLISEAGEKTKLSLFSSSASEYLHRNPSTHSSPTSQSLPCRHPDIDIEAQTSTLPLSLTLDPIISNGSRGNGTAGPPPYMPSPTIGTLSHRAELDNAITALGNMTQGVEEEEDIGSTIRGYGKDGEFPGLER